MVSSQHYSFHMVSIDVVSIAFVVTSALAAHLSENQKVLENYPIYHGIIPHPEARNFISSENVQQKTGFMQEKAKSNPVFSGQIMAGKELGTLKEDITDDAIKTMVSCSFYKANVQSCFPSDPITPCRYCKEKASRAGGQPECPSDDSIPDEYLGKYEWRIKPLKKKGKYLNNTWVCMVHDIPPEIRTTASPYKMALRQGMTPMEAEMHVRAEEASKGGLSFGPSQLSEAGSIITVRWSLFITFGSILMMDSAWFSK